jgi:hypothetical protein
VLLWTCVVQLTAVGNIWGPRVLKGWPSCRTAREAAAAAAATTTRLAMPEPVVEKAVLPPKSECYRSASRWIAYANCRPTENAFMIISFCSDFLHR